MKIKIKAIQQLLIDVLTTKNISKTDAIIIANEYLEGEIEGKQSHGLMAFPNLIKKLPLPKSKPVIKKRTASYIFIDAQKNLGILLGKKYTDEAIKMAEKQGIAVVFIKNMLSWLRPSAIAKYIAEKNMVGLVINDGGSPAIAPPGGYSPMIGTNPIGIGIPTSNQNILVDMATAKRAWGEVRKAMANNTKLPTETYFDKQGNFTTDPKKADSVIAMGDYKGFALALFIEIMAGSFINKQMSGTVNDPNERSRPRGAMIMVFNPAFSTNITKFKKANTALVKKIKNSKKIKGVKSILIPGERAWQNKNLVLKSGTLDVDEKLWDKLLSLKK